MDKLFEIWSSVYLGEMQKVISYNSFSRSRSDPSKQHPVEKAHIIRTLSHPSYQPKPTAADFFSPVSCLYMQAPTMLKPCELMKQAKKPKEASRTTFKIVDPLRVVGDFSRPPKRFFRTFWQSTAKKLLQKYRE